MELPKSKTIRYTLLSLRDLAISFGPFILLAVALLAVTYWWPDPNPPKRVTLATSPAQSTYEEFGKRYFKAFQANGITVELIVTQDSAANLELLRAGKVDVGFVQAAQVTMWLPTRQTCRRWVDYFLEPL